MSTGAVVPVTFTVQDQGLLRTIAQIERASQGAAKSITGIGDTAKISAVGKRLQAVSEDLANYKRGIEEVVEQNFIWGASGTALVNEIENIRDPLKRLELGQRALAGVTSTTGKALGSVTQGIATARAEAAIWAGGVENLALLTGGLGLAVGALTVGIGALGGLLLKVASGALQAYIAGTKEAAKVQADFEATTGRAEKRLGELIYKTIEYDKITRGAEVGVSTLERGISKVSDSQGLLNEHLALAAVAFPDYASQILLVGRYLNEVEIATRDTDYSTRILTDSVTSQRNEYNLLAASLQGVARSLDDVAQSAQRATPYLTGLEAGEATGASQSRAGLRRRTGGGGRGAGGRQTFSGAAGAITGAAGQFGGAGARQGAGQAGLALSGGGGATLGFGPEGTVEGDALIGFLGLEQVVSGQRGAGGRERTRQQAGANVADQINEINRATQAYESLGLSIDAAKGAAVGLAGSFASVASGLASGEVKAKDFGKAIRGAAGSLFADLGKGFVLQGTARLIAGDVLGGPALIGAGLALSAFGGALSRQGGGGGQTRSSGSAGAVAAATRASPTLQRERERERPIILRVGERDIRGVITDYNQDAQRRGAGGRTR